MSVGPEATDRLAAQILAAAKPVRAHVAEDRDELDRLFRLRFQTAADAGWIDSGDHPDGRETDPWDAAAVHIAAHEGEALLGTVRMVLPRPGRRLPLEEAYEIAIDPAGKVVDGGRLVITPDRRGDEAHRVLAVLFAFFWQQARARGFHRIAAVAPEGVIELYRSLGLEVDVLAPARDYWGDERYPIRLSAGAATFAGARGAEALS